MSMPPDAGTAVLMQHFKNAMSGFDYSAQRHEPAHAGLPGPVSVAEPLTDGGPPVAGVEFGAALMARLGDLTAAIEQQVESERARLRAFAQIMHQRPIGPQTIPLTSGAGLLDIPDLFAAKDGYFMSLRRITAASFTAGSVVMYEDGVADMNIAVPWQPGVPATFTFGRGEQLLMGGSRWVFNATGITGQVTINGKADIGPLEALGDYLGVR